MDDLKLEPYDAFPNAEGLSQRLDLHKANKLPPRFDSQGRYWYSICSIHQDGADDCDLCLIGSYKPITPEELDLP